MKYLLILLILFNLFLVSAVETPHTVEIITARGKSVFPVSFFNSGPSATYTASLASNSNVVKIETPSINVNEEEFGSFNLLIGNEGIERGIYFDKLIIKKGEEIFQEIPVVIGLESSSSQLEYDVSIDFDATSDITNIAGETILSPVVNVYKLNYNNANQNSVALKYSVYTIDGELISSDEEVVSVARQASFEHFFNLGSTLPNEVLIVVSARREDSFGLDLSQVSLENNILLSPPTSSNYPYRIYISVFTFLVASIMLISYLWYNRSLNEAKDWKAELQYVKKTQFSDSAKAMRKLESQKEVLDRAYTSRYISKDSYDAAIKEIDRTIGQLKKRL
jgi:hypothetical protein